MGFVASLMDDSFAPGGEKLLEPAAELLGELICDPVTERGRFVGAYFESERTNLIDAIRSVINDKREYADTQRSTVSPTACPGWGTRRRRSGSSPGGSTACTRS